MSRMPIGLCEMRSIEMDEGEDMIKFLKVETPFVALLSGLFPLPW